MSPIDRVPIASLSSDPANVRKHGAKNLEAIKASLRRFGQQKPIVVDADGVVRAGNGQLAAATALGWESIDVVRTELRGAEAVAYAIADNRTAELAEWDDHGLAEQLRALQSEVDGLAGVGFDESEVDALLEKLGDEYLAAAGEALPIADEAHGTSPAAYLAWGAEKVPITEDEAARLDRALDRHRAESGTSFGFVAAMVADV